MVLLVRAGNSILSMPLSSRRSENNSAVQCCRAAAAALTALEGVCSLVFKHRVFIALLCRCMYGIRAMGRLQQEG